VGGEGVGRCRRCRLFSAVGCRRCDLPRCSHFLWRPHHPAAAAAAAAAAAGAAAAAAAAAAATVAGVPPPPPPKTRSSHWQWPPPATTAWEAWAAAGASPRALAGNVPRVVAAVTAWEAWAAAGASPRALAGNVPRVVAAVGAADAGTATAVAAAAFSTAAGGTDGHAARGAPQVVRALGRGRLCPGLAAELTARVATKLVAAAAPARG